MEVEHFFTCPHCWSRISMILDLSVSPQSYVEDCEVCCQPILIKFDVADGELTDFAANKQS